MLTLKPVLDELASLLSYPREDYKPHVHRCVELLESAHTRRPIEDSKAIIELRAFREGIGPLSLEEIEELFTRTFDMNPICSLEIGWHLFGETYERGAFLVQMRDLLKRTGVEESSELPDHFSHVLHAIGRMQPDEAEIFVSTRFLKALDKMLEGFSTHDNPFVHVLNAVRDLVETSVTPELQKEKV